MDLLPMRALMELSRLYEAGCAKYGARNWEEGIPAHCYIDSAMRHLAKFLAGHADECHLTQACWNVLCLLDTLLRVQEGTLPDDLYDLPTDWEDVKFFTPPPPGGPNGPA